MAAANSIDDLPRARVLGSSSTGGPGPWATVTVQQLRAIRGGMFVTRGAVPYGPRPDQPDNIISLNALANLYYDQATSERVIREYKARGYTHGSVGAFVSLPYHGQDPGITIDDFLANHEQVADRLEMIWRGGIIPIVFLEPDNWSLDQMRQFEPVFRSARWQDLVKMCVPKGYEPSIDTPNQEWCDHFDWAHDVFPRALYYVHMCTNFDAPGNNTDLSPYLDQIPGNPPWPGAPDDPARPKNPEYLGNEGSWANLAPRAHGWLIQNGPFGTPTQESADFQNVCDQFRADVRATIRDRFHNNYAGWPSASAWDWPEYRDVPRKFRGLDLYAGEYCAYSAWHQNFPENECQKWGDGPLANDADGSFDGCHVSGPVGARVSTARAPITPAPRVVEFPKPWNAVPRVRKPWF